MLFWPRASRYPNAGRWSVLVETLHSFGGKSALVTGAGRGIGAAIARRLAQAGAGVVVAARQLDAASALVATLRDEGLRAIAVGCDVTDHAQVAAAVEACRKAFGSIDVLVNNAGTIEPIARIADADPGAWGAVIDANLKGVLHGMHAVLPTMLAQGAGTVITISSGAATSPLEGWSHYCASKAATLMLTRCLDREYRGQGIRSLGLSPGTVATDMRRAIRTSGINPVSQMDFSAHVPPEWAAEAVAWLCTPAADAFLGQDFSLKTEEGRALVGLPGLRPG